MTPTRTLEERQELARRWALVTAEDIMRTDVVTLSYAAPLSEVERTLSDHGISGAPVTDAAGHVVGIVSLKDLVQRYADDPDSHPRRGAGFYHLSPGEGADDEEACDAFAVPEEAEEIAADIMTAQVFSVPVDAGLQEIASKMSEHRVHRVLVKDGERYVGLVSTLEVLGALGA